MFSTYENKLTPEEQLEDKDVKNELHQALKKLPERERMIMVLYYHENMTLKDIGDMIADIIDGLELNPNDNSVIEEVVKAKVKQMTIDFPIYPKLKG